MYVIANELYHHGIKGQKWGVRRYQNPDGTRTPAGKRHDAKLAYKQKLKDSNKKYQNDLNSLKDPNDISKVIKISGEYDKRNAKIKKDYKTDKLNLKRNENNERIKNTAAKINKKYVAKETLGVSAAGVSQAVMANIMGLPMGAIPGIATVGTTLAVGARRLTNADSLNKYKADYLYYNTKRNNKKYDKKIDALNKKYDKQISKIEN
jgi:hypothetical protein